jgi:hypothetical protein
MKKKDNYEDFLRENEKLCGKYELEVTLESICLTVPEYIIMNDKS